MIWLIFAIPLLSLLFLSAFVVDEWLEEKQKKEKEKEIQKRKEEFVVKYLTK